MEARTLNQQVSDARVAFQIQSQRLEEAKNELILARVKRPLNERKIKECESKIQALMAECEKIKELQESLDLEKADERKRKKNIEVFILEQVKIADRLKTESADLLKQLRAAQAINLRILQLDAQYNEMAKETGKKPDRTKTSSGFHSLRTIVEILESEVSGEGRKMFYFTNRFLV